MYRDLEEETEEETEYVEDEDDEDGDDEEEEYKTDIKDCTTTRWLLTVQESGYPSTRVFPRALGSNGYELAGRVRVPHPCLRLVVAAG